MCLYLLISVFECSTTRTVRKTLRTESTVDQRKVRVKILVLKIRVVLGKLLRCELTLVHNFVRTEGTHVEILRKMWHLTHLYLCSLSRGVSVCFFVCVCVCSYSKKRKE